MDYLKKVYEYEDEVTMERHTGEGFGSIMAIINPKNKVIISAPHSVKHLRNNTIKSADVNTYGIARLLHELTGASIITLTGYLECDPNYEYCEYKDMLKSIVSVVNPICLIDLHGCKESDYYDIILCTDYDKSLLGNTNIKEEITCSDKLAIECNTKFTASNPDTVTNFCYSKLCIPAVQLELTYSTRCTDKVSLFIEHLSKCIMNLNNR